MTKPLDILVFGAHPDDAEIGMGGTIAKHTADGYQVGVCDLTQAEMSSNGSVVTRSQEAAEASRLLGLTVRTNLGLPDRGLELCQAHIEAVTLEIRRHRPRMVFAPYWEDRHPDHVLCSKIVQEAIFNAKLRRYLPSTEAVSVERLFFYFINDTYEPHVTVDVSDVYERKQSALRAYETQFQRAGATNDFVPTPINQGYLERVKARDYLLGQRLMVKYAEGFISKQPIAVNLF